MPAIDRIRLLRNISQFDSVDAGAQLPCSHVTLVHSENGRGKTTLAAVFRSLATGDALPIIERARVGATNPPHVVLALDDLTEAVFENAAWNRTIPDALVFDDEFVDSNVYSGLVVGPDQRQHLHGLVIGAQAVTLTHELEDIVERIETHNANLRAAIAPISAANRGGLPIDEFCALPTIERLDERIVEAERALAVSRDSAAVLAGEEVPSIVPPPIDRVAIEAVLTKGMPALDALSLERVHQHLARIGTGGEAWVADGMQRLDAGEPEGECPFCAQQLEHSPVLATYRQYFGEEYRHLLNEISDAATNVNRFHGGDAQAAFERTVRVALERQRFWEPYVGVAPLTVDTTGVVAAWRAAREAVLANLGEKALDPLTPRPVSAAVGQAINAYSRERLVVEQVDNQLKTTNLAIRAAKERAVGANMGVAEAELNRLAATRVRHEAGIDQSCTRYVAERQAKRVTEARREELRQELDRLRTQVFPSYQDAINRYLGRLNAEFRLADVVSVNTRGGPAMTYSVVIRNTPIPVSGDRRAGVPSFRTTLSAGDRSTLALAFFLALADQHPALAQQLVVIDDPVSSLDDQRIQATVFELHRLAERVVQLVVLSHNKPFLCRLWDSSDRTDRSALQVFRVPAGSSLRAWRIEEDAITEHDKRDSRLRDYTGGRGGDPRRAAQDLRPHLEAFIRVAYPGDFPPETLLGAFIEACRRRLRRPDQILDATDLAELTELTTFSNRFQHDTNPAYDTEPITDGEAAAMARRVLAFTRRR